MRSNSRPDVTGDGMASTERASKARSPSVGSTDGEPGKRQSFAFGLGLTSLSNSVSKAGDKMSSLTRKHSNTLAEKTTTPPTTPGAGASPPLTAVFGTNSASAGSMAPPPNPDPKLLAHYSLKLNDIVNKSFLPCAPGAAAMGGATSVVAGSVSKAFGVGGNGTAAGVRDGVGIPTLSIISYDGKKLPDKAKVTELAQNVSEQLHYAASVDAYLLRAVARQILKALTLFATRVDSLLIPSAKDPNVLRIPSTPKEGRILPPAMEFNIGLAAIAWTLEDSLERCLEGEDGEHPQMPRFVSEILTPVRKHLEATILHVIQPILTGTKASITASVQKAVPNPFSPVGLLQSLVSGPISDQRSPNALSVAADGAASPMLPYVTSPGDISPSAKSTESASSSAWLKDLDARLSGCRRMLVARIENRTSKDGEGWFISVAIHIIWKALFILSSRHAEPVFMCTTFDGSPLSPQGGPTRVATINGLSSVASLVDSSGVKRSPSPAQLSSALKAVALSNKPRRSESLDTSRNASGAATPGKVCSQPVPDGGFYRGRKVAQIVSDLTSFEKLVKEFCSGFTSEPVRRSNLASHVVVAAGEDDVDSSSEESDEEDELARAALAEALQGLKSIITCVQVLEFNPQSVALALRGKGQPRDASPLADPAQTLPAETVRAFRAAPPLILLHVLFNRLPLTSGRIHIPAPNEAFGLSWQQYEQSIPGFVGGHTWADALLSEWKPFLETNLAELDSQLEAAEKDAEQARLQQGGAELQNHEANELRRSLTHSSRSSESGNRTPPDENQTMSNSVPTLERSRAYDATRAGSERKAYSRDPSPEGEAKEPTQRTPRFWRTNSGVPRGFTLPSLSRTASPRGRDGTDIGILMGPATDPATAAKLLVEEIRTEIKALRNFARNLEALAAHMGKEFKINVA